MTMCSRAGLVGAVAVAALGGLASGAAAQATLPPLYDVEDLRPYSAARLGIGGRMAGARLLSPTDYQAAIFEDGVWHNLGTLPDDQYSLLLGINANGEAVGSSAGYFRHYFTDYYRSQTVLGTATGGLSPMSGINTGSLNSASHFAQSINDNGIIVGCQYQIDCPPYYCVSGNQQAFVRQASGAVIAPLGSSSNYSCAVDVNNSDTVVGYEIGSGPQGAILRGFRYQLDGGALTWLETSNARLSTARRINEAGDIVGEGRPKDSQVYLDQAFVYTAAGELRDLGLAALGASSSTGTDINARGEVVGYFQLLDSSIRAFVARGGQVFDLNDAVELSPEWTVQSAHDIDDAGRILASVKMPVTPPPPSGETYDYATVLLTPANRPPTSALAQDLSVAEGGALSLEGATADDDPGTLLHAWSVDSGPGAIEGASGPSATFSASGVDGTAASTAIVRLTVTDASGATATAVTQVQIDNVSPTATLSATPGSVYPGEVVVLSFSGAADPSAADTAAGFAFAYACSEADPLGPFSIATSHPCSYSQAGIQVARGRIADKDSGSSDYTVDVTVASYQAGVGGLIEMIESLVTGGVLTGGNANSLISKLESAIQQLDRANIGPAINKLQAFINEVEAYIRSGRLEPGLGQPLVDEARRIIAALAG